MTKRKLRILFNSNAPFAPSGYGQQMADILPLIKEYADVAVVCFFGLQGGTIEWNGIKCYPKIADQWGADAMVEHAKDFNPDCVITLQDIWTLDPNMLKQVKNWIPIVPIDHENVVPAIEQRLNMAYRVITYSKFGEEQLNDIGIHSTYIPHTVNTKLFKKQDKLKIRKSIGIPEDYFVFGMVAANKDNPPRKSFQQVLDAFKMFNKAHPKSAIYFHTILEQSKGFPIERYSKFLGIDKFVYKPNPYDLLYKITKEQMSNVYSSFDCLLAPSTNEGFGVPMVEAQSCEVPVIANDITAMPYNLIDGKTGYLTKVAYKRFTPLNGYIGIPDTQSIYNSMEKVYKADREKMGKEGRKFVKKNYDLNKVFNENWLPFIKTLESELIDS
jgi:glycosyltransferase involved in cell wall biosynthesis